MLHPDHPVSVMLKMAAHGTQITREMLDDQLSRKDLPEGHDLNRHRRAIASALADVHATARPNEHTLNSLEARRAAESHGRTLSAMFTGPEAALRGDNPATIESTKDITDRMFANSVTKQLFG